MRRIDEPCQALKIIQEELNQYLYRFPVHQSLKAYVKGCSGTKETAMVHQFEFRGKDRRAFLRRPPKWMLKIDLKDFFPSITMEDVRRVLRLSFYENQEIQGEHELFHQFVDLIVWLVAGNGCLLQGAPTSPYLANLVWTRSNVIERILRYLSSRKRDFNLAIYADDISISFLERRYPAGVVKNIAEIINSSKCFRINPEKTEMKRLKHGAFKITGISISRGYAYEPALGISQKYLNTLRGQIHRANIILYDEGRWPDKDADGVSTSEIMGKLNWVRSVIGPNKKWPSIIRKVAPRFLAVMQQK